MREEGRKVILCTKECFMARGSFDFDSFELARRSSKRFKYYLRKNKALLSTKVSLLNAHHSCVGDSCLTFLFYVRGSVSTLPQCICVGVRMCLFMCACVGVCKLCLCVFV